MYIEKDTKKMTLFAAIAVLINVLANFALVPYLALLGSAIATLISYGFLYTLLAFHSMKTIRIKPDGKLVLAGLGAAIIMYGILSLFPTAHTIAFFMVKMIVGTAVYGISLLVLSAEIRKNFRATILQSLSRRTVIEKVQ
jgi:peptidoglycan biosynthesis protein MviN/MurJ (putative lipid II flippase)